MSKYTDREREVIQHLSDAWNSFVVMCSEQAGHPDDESEFRTAVHVAQGIVATRLAARCEPEMHPAYHEDFTIEPAR